MVHDPLLQKAWEIRHQTECFPVETILKATVWLVEKHEEAPQWKTAIAIVVQYLVLGMRQESQGIAKVYFSQALRWREEAGRLFNEQKLLTAYRGQN
ncbi:MAG: hypothetical protein HY694_15515 [Deltaproteobacteria bacterium]|nr:hypothetical protein [Deltaproteobacteria bacterium]